MQDEDGGLAAKYERLLAILRALDPVAVAFSGGTDSSFLLHAAVLATGPSVPAFFADSQLLAPDEKDKAREVGSLIGCGVRVVAIDPLSWPEFVDNPADRCYHCKKKIYSLLLAETGKSGRRTLLDGTNVDDLRDHRPGLRAVRELGVRAPLAEAGLTKREIRQLSRRAALPTWNKLSASCLATRIPAGSAITAERLMVVGQGENQLAEQGFFGSRVRLHGDSVRLELMETDLKRFVGTGALSATRDFLQSLGVAKVFLDLAGRPDPGFGADSDEASSGLGAKASLLN